MLDILICIVTFYFIFAGFFGLACIFDKNRHRTFKQELFIIIVSGPLVWGFCIFAVILVSIFVSIEYVYKKSSSTKFFKWFWNDVLG